MECLELEEEVSLRRAAGRLGSAAAAALRPAWTRMLGEAPLPAKTSRKLSVLGGSRPLAETCSLARANCSIDLSMSSILSIVDESEERELSDGWRQFPSMHVLCTGVLPSSLGARLPVRWRILNRSDNCASKTLRERECL